MGITKTCPRILAGLLISAVLLFTGCQKPAPTTTPPADTGVTSPAAGYLAVAGWDMGFLAVGTDGRADVIDSEGATTPLQTGTAAHLYDVAVADGTALLVGDCGTALFWDGEAVTSCPASSLFSLMSCAYFKGNWYAAGNGNTLLVWRNGRWEEFSLETGGEVVGMAATADLLMGVTAKGHVFTTDGNTLTAHFPNGERAAEKALAFRDVTVLGNSFWATAVCADGTPAVLTSLYGGVWKERELAYMDGKPFDPTALSLYGAAPSGNQLIVTAGDSLLTLPDCVECNTMRDMGEGTTYTALAYHGGRLAAVGAEFAATVLEAEAVAQYKISPATAKAYQEAGARLIDVRSAEDYATRHIAGALSLPLEELENVLPRLAPDYEATLVFYCTKGMRSQTAVEKALAMGYVNVYTLGAMEEWPYDFA